MVMKDSLTNSPSQTGENKMMTMEELKARIVEAGYRPSKGSWEDENRIFAFSIEVCPNTYGHSKYSLDYRKNTGKLYHDGKEQSAAH